MPRLSRFELMDVDLPLRHAFRHAAATRSSAEGLFLKCVTDNGATGFGECLPRKYVTGETRIGAFTLLRDSILPRLVGMEFGSMQDVYRFLTECDGQAPSGWTDSGTPQSAAWCAVDLALLDALGHAFGQPARPAKDHPDSFAYSGVASANSGSGLAASLLKLRLYGFRQVKLKAGREDVLTTSRLARRIMGSKVALRIDANMAWRVDEALEWIHELSRYGVHCIEQPLDAADLRGMAKLVRGTDAEIIADESLTDCASLACLVEERACTGVNVRISKCGGLIAAARRCEEALSQGLTVQIGCQVGESSLLSAAQLILISTVRGAKYFEGCFGRHLLRTDPVRPCLQFGYGGRPPRLPGGVGLGVQVDEAALNQSVTNRAVVAERGARRREAVPCPSHSLPE